MPFETEAPKWAKACLTSAPSCLSPTTRAPRSSGGLWRTQVLGVQITGRPRPFGPGADSGGGLLSGAAVRMARVLVGDPGGAQAELVLPYDSRRAGRGRGWGAGAPVGG